VPLLVLAIIIAAVLVAVGRAGRTQRLGGIGRVVVTLLAAACAFAVALRGLWIVSLILIAVALYFGSVRRPVRQDPADPMPADEACAILGVSRAASRSEVESAYRRLMLRAHPDRGGTVGLAARLNAARDRLLKKN
jgi:uncharacterized membrane protein